MSLKTPRTRLKRLPKRGAGSSLWQYLRAAPTKSVHLNIEREHTQGRVVKL